jgi:transposase
MQQFLTHFAATIGKNEHAVMVLDQAGWHDARALSVPGNITLVALPPYSPELNPVERRVALPQGALSIAPIA